MPLNVPKNYAFTPTPVGPVKLTTRSSTRSRLVAGGTYFRSKEYGEQANLIKLTVVEDLTLVPREGLWIEQHTVFKADEMVAVANMAMPTHELFDLTLAWNEELRIRKVGDSVVCEKYGIRWQTTGPLPAETLLAEYGPLVPGRLLNVPGVVSVKVQFVAADWPASGIFYLRPRTHRLTLVPLDVTDPETMLVTTGWDIGVLRATLNGTASAWTKMPIRGTSTGEPPGPPTAGEDVQDEGTDDEFLTTFGPTAMAGGDGLPLFPVGLNTGPDRVLVHLNYAEKEDGSMGELNQVFEWVGESARIGSWQRYS